MYCILVLCRHLLRSETEYIILALSYKWGMIIVQMGDDYRTNGGSIIVQMGDGAKPLPRRCPEPTSRAILRPGSLHYYPNEGQVRSS